jgi:hypothetical protein
MSGAHWVPVGHPRSQTDPRPRTCQLPGTRPAINLGGNDPHINKLVLMSIYMACALDFLVATNKSSESYFV